MYLRRHHFYLRFREDVAIDEDGAIVHKTRDSHEVVLRMPVTAHQLTLQVETQVLDADLSAGEDIPQQRLPRLRRRQEVLVIRGDRAVDHFSIVDAAGVHMVQSDLVAD